MTIEFHGWIAAGFMLGFMIPAFLASLGLGFFAFYSFDKAVGRIVRRMKNQKWRAGR